VPDSRVRYSGANWWSAGSSTGGNFDVDQLTIADPGLLTDSAYLLAVAQDSGNGLNGLYVRDGASVRHNLSGLVNQSAPGAPFGFFLVQYFEPINTLPFPLTVGINWHATVIPGVPGANFDDDAGAMAAVIVDDGFTIDGNISFASPVFSGSTSPISVDIFNVDQIDPNFFYSQLLVAVAAGYITGDITFSGGSGWEEVAAATQLGGPRGAQVSVAVRPSDNFAAVPNATWTYSGTHTTRGVAAFWTPPVTPPVTVRGRSRVIVID